MNKLRPYQEKSIQELRVKFQQGYKRLMLMGCCAFGKTTVASEMIQSCLGRGKRALFIVDRLELIEQASERFDCDGIPHGIIQANHWRKRITERLQVCSIQTLARRDIPHADLVIIDEAHVLYKTHKKLMESWTNVSFVGLSATPFTKSLGKYFQDVVIGSTVAELIKQNYLVEPEYYGPNVPDLRKLQKQKKNQFGETDWDDDELGQVMSDPVLIADVVDSYLQLGAGRQGLTFACNIAHSKKLCKKYKEKGVNAEHIDAYTKPEIRKEIINAYRKGRLDMLVNVGILEKGADFPGASYLAKARPTKSLMVDVQQTGRILRISPDTGKKDAIIADHTGNWLLHGFITDQLPTKLHDGNKTESVLTDHKPTKASKCKSCGFIRPAGIHKCPICGFAPERQSEIDEHDGELVCIKKTKTKKEKYSAEYKVNFYAQLKSYAASKDYSLGWVNKVYNMKFKEIPGKNLQDIKPKSVEREVINFIKYLAIRRSKGKGRANAA